MKRTTYHQEQNRKAAILFNVLTDEDLLTRQIRELEKVAHPNERTASLIKTLRQERTDLIIRNIGRY